jgi:hypothetical protein
VAAGAEVTTGALVAGAAGAWVAAGAPQAERMSVATNKTASMLKMRFIVFFSLSDELGWFG